MIIPPITPDQFTLTAAVSEAITLINATSGIVMLVAGMGVGIVFVSLIMAAVRSQL